MTGQSVRDCGALTSKWDIFTKLLLIDPHRSYTIKNVHDDLTQLDNMKNTINGITIN